MSNHPPSRLAPLAQADWRHVDKIALEDFQPQDWQLLEQQRRRYLAGHQASQTLRLLTASRDDPSFGYMVNNYRHCLQSATMALRAGLDEEDVVVALLHDVGFITCPLMHGDFAAQLLGAYISDRNYWMLQHHATFQNVHTPHLPGVRQHERDLWRGHPFFDWTAEFVALYDQAAADPDYRCEPIETFVPMVQRIFARQPVDRRTTTLEINAMTKDAR